MTARKSIWAVALLGLGGIGAAAQTYNQYGETGLIDMPTAETLPDGQLGLGYTWFDGTQRGNVSFQLLPRVSGTARIATYADSLMGADESDVGFDLKFQLLEEDGMLPGLALGFRDIFGDGPYGAEYLSASGGWAAPAASTTLSAWSPARRSPRLTGSCRTIPGSTATRPSSAGSAGIPRSTA